MVPWDHTSKAGLHDISGPVNHLLDLVADMQVMVVLVVSELVHLKVIERETKFAVTVQSS